jgi:hypothetical protein
MRELRRPPKGRMYRFRRRHDSGHCEGSGGPARIEIRRCAV